MWYVLLYFYKRILLLILYSEDVSSASNHLWKSNNEQFKRNTAFKLRYYSTIIVGVLTFISFVAFGFA